MRSATDEEEQVFHLIDSKSDGREVLFVLARDFLHQPDEDGAAVHSVVRLVVHVLQTDEELRVGAESFCRQRTACCVSTVM